MATLDDDRVHNPMIYDALLELATRICGRYVAWTDRATTQAEAQHWRDEAAAVRQWVSAVDVDSRSAIEDARAELRELWAKLPAEAPVFAA